MSPTTWAPCQSEPGHLKWFTIEASILATDEDDARRKATDAMSTPGLGVVLKRDSLKFAHQATCERCLPDEPHLSTTTLERRNKQGVSDGK
jgi:hypothetical protein